MKKNCDIRGHDISLSYRSTKIVLWFWTRACSYYVLIQDRVLQCNKIYPLFPWPPSESLCIFLRKIDSENLKLLWRCSNRICILHLQSMITVSYQVLSYAPNNQYGADFNMVAMNLVDQVLSKVGKSDDGLGPNWTPIERVAHKLHMWDLWTKIQSKYNSVEEPSNVVSNPLLDQCK